MVTYGFISAVIGGHFGGGGHFDGGDHFGGGTTELLSLRLLSPFCYHGNEKHQHQVPGVALSLDQFWFSCIKSGKIMVNRSRVVIAKSKLCDPY